jgi:DNA invertase Pin-like site-specific DNA recombinase
VTTRSSPPAACSAGAAAANGRKGGRPRKVDDADAAKARQLREKGITATDIAKMLGVARATVYRYLAVDVAAL